MSDTVSIFRFRVNYNFETRDQPWRRFSPGHWRKDKWLENKYRKREKREVLRRPKDPITPSVSSIIHPYPKWTDCYSVYRYLWRLQPVKNFSCERPETCTRFDWEGVTVESHKESTPRRTIERTGPVTKDTLRLVSIGSHFGSKREKWDGERKLVSGFSCGRGVKVLVTVRGVY